MNVPGDGPIHVLHVDDDPDFADLIATILERESDRLAVETATDAAAAMERIQADAPDVVVSDYDMPGENGIEFLDLLREDLPDLPFILYTGKGSEAVASRAISAGVTDYIQKSAGRGEYELLANRIENAVAQRRAERAVERSEARLRTVVDSIPHPVFVVDREPRYLISNPVHAAAHGMTVEAVEGTPVSEVLVPAVFEGFADALEEALETDEVVYEPRVEMPGPDGETRVYESRLVAIEMAEYGRAALGISIDVTDREQG